MGTSERQQRIVAGLAAGEMSVDALAERLSDSSSAVRHELAPLGQVRRAYGGAALAGHSLEHISTVKGRGALAEKNAIRRVRRPAGEREGHRPRSGRWHSGPVGVAAAEPSRRGGGVDQAAIARARRIVVLADHRKLAARPFDHWAPIHREHLLVTDTGATAEQLDRFTADLLATVETVEPLALTTATLTP